MKIIISKKGYIRHVKKSVVPRVVWCFWDGEEMNKTREDSLLLMSKHLEVPVCLITTKNINEFILSKAPLHPGYYYLSSVHKSDYLRIYLLHYYGGGWHDIKPTEISFKNVWDEFEDSNVFLVGKPEIKNGPAKIYDNEGRWMRRYWKDLVSCGAWVGKANTLLSKEMIKNINCLLDENLELLKLNPPKNAYDCKIKKYRYFKKKVLGYKEYPLDWTVFGNIFHPLNYKYRHNVKKTLPFDLVENLGRSYR